MDGQNIIQLKGTAGVSHVVDFHTRALDAIQSGLDVVFDFEDAQDFDASILQLLLAATNAANDCDAQVSVLNVSQSIAQSFENQGAGELVSSVLDCEHKRDVE